MVVFGLLSSAFDLLTFALLLQVFDADSTLFRTGWFVGSTLTELAVLFVLRTRRPVWRSRPGKPLIVSSLVVAAITVSLPFVAPALPALGITQPPVGLVLTLVAVTACYVATAEVTKRVFFHASRTGRGAATPAPMSAEQRRLHRVAREHGHEVARAVPAGVTATLVRRRL